MRLLVRGLRLAEQQTRASTGLSAAALFLLRRIADGRPASVGDLAERTLTDRSSVAAVVERLGSVGLVEANRDPQDRRRVLVRITAAGREVLDAAPPAPTDILLDALDRMERDAVRALSASLHVLTREMGLTGVPGMLFEDQAGGRRA